MVKKVYSRLIGVRRTMFLAGLGLMCWTACETETCISEANNDMQVRFLKTDSTTQRQVRFRYLLATGNDSVFYADDTDRTVVSFPLNPEQDGTEFTLQLLDTVFIDTLSLDPIVTDTVRLYRPPDTLAVRYARRQRIITEECGVEISYGGLSIEKSSFPGYLIVNQQVSRFNEFNLEVYY